MTYDQLLEKAPQNNLWKKEGGRKVCKMKLKNKWRMPKKQEIIL